MILVNKHKLYTFLNYQYKNFLLLTDEEKQQVLTWRNHDNVRKWMYNDGIIPLENHLKFIDSLQNRTDCYYWLAYKNNEPYGVVNITDVDEENNKAEVGLYRNPTVNDNGGGLDLYWSYYGFLFFSLNIDVLIAGIALDNTISLLLNSFLGFQKTGLKSVFIHEQAKEFYVAKCVKSDILQDWDQINDIRAMLEYYESDAFKNWKD
jgi:UDP-4-amino-4,6-dideoxy-N-acetyl-beta-L-altrosamine N-acetyltransferase